MPDWKVYEYESYDEYVKAQIHANHKKENLVWVQKKAIEKIYQYLPDAHYILCHGTRNGEEIELFKWFYERCVITGTEISDTATKYRHTVQWDFHEVNPEWEGQMDIVYSNSFDHSYDPVKCLTTWRDQLSDNGMLVIEFQEQPMKYSDPLEISKDAFENLCSQLGLEVDRVTDGSHEVRNQNLYFLKKV